MKQSISKIAKISLTSEASYLFGQDFKRLMRSLRRNQVRLVKHVRKYPQHPLLNRFDYSSDIEDLAVVFPPSAQGRLVATARQVRRAADNATSAYAVAYNEPSDAVAHRLIESTGNLQQALDQLDGVVSDLTKGSNR